MRGCCGTIALIVLLGCGGTANEGGSGLEQPVARFGESATVPIILDHHRVIVELDFVRPDGGARRAAAWVDTGNQYLIVGEALAEELGLDASGLEGSGDSHSVVSSSPAPAMRIGGVALNSNGVAVRVRRSGAWVLPGIPAEVCLPASALKYLHVILDGPARKMTVAPPGVLKPRGEHIGCSVNPDTGLFLIDATIDGEAVRLGVDTGSAGTWVSTALIDRWLERHPEWPRAVGAVGSANFFGFPFEAEGVLTSVPKIELGQVEVRDAAVLGLGQELFDWYSQKSAAAVSGFIGGNVLSRCHLEIDFPNLMTWWELGPAPEQRDLDIVGLTVRPDSEGGFTVAAVATRGGEPTVDGVEAGDRLLRVGELETTGATMGEVVAALRGPPGEPRALLLERGGVEVRVEAPVTRFP